MLMLQFFLSFIAIIWNILYCVQIFVSSILNEVALLFDFSFSQILFYINQKNDLNFLLKILKFSHEHLTCNVLNKKYEFIFYKVLESFFLCFFILKWMKNIICY